MVEIVELNGVEYVTSKGKDYLKVRASVNISCVGVLTVNAENKSNAKKEMIKLLESTQEAIEVILDSIKE